MLCLHGNPTWSYLWRRFLSAAPRGWRVVAVDQLGMGFSERPPGPRRLAERVDDLARVVEQLEIVGPVVVVAHDWGGPVALGWAQGQGDRIVGLVLANTGVAFLPGRALPGLIRVARNRLLRELICVRTSLFVRGAALLSRPVLPADVRAALRAPYRSADLRRAVGDFVADIPFERHHPSRQALETIASGLSSLQSVPTLLLWGPRDPVFGADYLRDLLARLPAADVHRYPGSSHLVTEDATQAAADAWRWILARAAPVPPIRPAGGTTSAPGLGARAPSSPTLSEAMRARARESSPAIAELRGDSARVASFAELAARVARLAGGLRRAGVRPGDRVALLLRPGMDLVATAYACWRAGASIVVADAGLGLRRMAEALRSADPQHLIAIPAGVAAAAALRIPGRRVVAGHLPELLRRALAVSHALAELEAGSPLAEDAADDRSEAAVLFTSGATGTPKGVVYRHEQLRAQLALVRTVCEVREGDRLVAAFAPFALYGPALGIGAAVPDMDVTRPATLTATALARAVAAVDATLVFASPAALRNVAATAADLTPELGRALGRIRLVLSAGAPVPLPLLRSIQVVLPGAELHTPYGMTEALPVTDVSLSELEAAGAGNGVCVGRPLPGVAIRVAPLDHAGGSAASLTDEAELTGEICISGAHLKARYDRLWATEHASAARPGWHRSGDVGHLDPAGRLWVEGRLVHVISTASGPVTPVGLEQRIEALPSVDAAAVVGVGPVGTQQVVAVVVPLGRAARRLPLADPVLSDDVRAAAGHQVAAVLVVDVLPVDIRHGSKVDRSRLARWAERVLSGGRVGSP
jgi:acyl-coenzyme A synthetase/AMP-(fatty) acid ligase/pimeloyl-ACP methyl ester carboxylesterase